MSMCTVTWRQTAEVGWYVNANLWKGKGDHFTVIKCHIFSDSGNIVINI